MQLTKFTTALTLMAYASCCLPGCMGQVADESTQLAPSEEIEDTTETQQPFGILAAGAIIMAAVIAGVTLYVQYRKPEVSPSTDWGIAPAPGPGQGWWPYGQGPRSPGRDGGGDFHPHPGPGGLD